MPAQASRLVRRIGPRDRRFLALVAATAASGIAAAAVLGGGGAHHGQAGCVRFNEAGVMGGGTWRLCGSAAATFCERRAAGSRSLAVQCDEALATLRPPAR